MGHAVSMELYAYWNALRAGRAAPERNEIEPAAIRSVLADTFVLEFDAGAGFPFRISGSRINALFLRELRGLSFLRLWRDTDRHEIESIIQRVADRTQPYLLAAEASPGGMGPLDIEVALLPLRHHGSNSFPHSRLSGRQRRRGLDWTCRRGRGDADLGQGVRGGGAKDNSKRAGRCGCRAARATGTVRASSRGGFHAPKVFPCNMALIRAP